MGCPGQAAKAGGPLYLRRFMAQLPVHSPETKQHLAGPAGERNIYTLRPRHAVLCLAESAEELNRQIGLVLSAGSIAMVSGEDLPARFARHEYVVLAEAPRHVPVSALVSGSGAFVRDAIADLARRFRPIVPAFTKQTNGAYPVEATIAEYATSINTSACGGTLELLAAAEA
jgi:RHH-type proline utilization regulon transcriptional repressor/proline dehydrogenase/delta 1-pyrroline-5-carboxylate dehydrogenase